jgi:DNA-binding beta-propeller fold protein YncE
MRSSCAALLLVATIGPAAVPACAADAEPPLVVERTISLENVSGRIDHMAVDLAGKRLFVAELGNGSVDVIDLQAGKVTGRISNLKDPQGVGYIPDRDLLVVAGARDGSVRFFNATNLAALGTVALGDDADNIRIDPVTGHVLVGYGDGGLAIIDAATRSKLDDIKLPGHPESFQIDLKSNRAYVNVPDAHQVAVVDLRSHKQIAAWKTPGLGSNFPMVLADEGKLLAVVFRNPAKLALVDPATGTITQTLETCGDADDVFFDSKRNRFYVSCGDGSVDVVQHNSEGLREAGRVATSGGARTSIFVPQLDRLFVAARAGWLGSRATLLDLRPNG